MAYQMVATVVTLNDLESHSSVAGLFKCNPSNICAAFYTISTDSVLARFLCISRASCFVQYSLPSIRLQNLTFVALSQPELIGGSQNSKVSHVTQATLHYDLILYFLLAPLVSASSSNFDLIPYIISEILLFKHYGILAGKRLFVPILGGFLNF